MKLLADFHTHSKDSRFFHGKNSIEEMAISANEMGLQEIAITDHGFKHIFKTSKDKLKKAREVVDELNEWSKTKILLGVEADIISEDGTLDIDNETLSYLDILLVGYHRMIKTDFAGYFGNQEKTEEAKQKCTNAFLNAIEKYPITILTHLDSVLTTDLYQIGCACRDKNVLVEINNRHTNWTEAQMEDLLASGCMFVVSSDAHSREDVGKVDHAFDIIRKYNIPSDLIVNVEFSEEEKSDTDKEFDVYFSLYQKKQAEREEKRKAFEEKKKTEFVNTLSPEMEEALQKIAKEQGINYKPNLIEEPDDDLDENILDFSNQLDEDLVRRAKEFIESNSISEFDAQNSKLESFDSLNDDENEKNAEEPIEQSDNITEQNNNTIEKISNTERKEEQISENIQKSFTSNNFGSKKSGFSFNLSELEEKNQSKENKTVNDVKSEKSSKNDIAGFVKFALDDNSVSKENTAKKQTNEKEAEKVKKQNSKFNPLGVLDETKNQDDNKK